MKPKPTLKIPSGIADTLEDLAYVVGAKGRIYCLEMTDGKVVARTEFAATPLTAMPGGIAGWRRTPGRKREIRLFRAILQDEFLHPKWETSILLPDWADVFSADREDFSLEAEIREGMLAATWEAHCRYGGGAPPPPQMEEAATKAESRTVLLDCETGEIVDEKPMGFAPEYRQLPPELPPNTQIAAYRSCDSWKTRPWRAGEASAFLIRTKQEPGICLFLKKDSGETSKVRLSEGPDAEAAVTPDGSMIFVYEPLWPGTDWRVYSSETGEAMASLGHDTGTKGVSVIGDRVVYSVEVDNAGIRSKDLRCRNLSTGKNMWSYRLHEETLKGPPPLAR